MHLPMCRRLLWDNASSAGCLCAEVAPQGNKGTLEEDSILCCQCWQQGAAGNSRPCDKHAGGKVHPLYQSLLRCIVYLYHISLLASGVKPPWHA